MSDQVGGKKKGADSGPVKKPQPVIVAVEKHWNRRKLIGAALLAIILLAVIGLIIFMFVRKSDGGKEQTAQQKQQEAHTDALSDATKANNSRNYNQEASSLQTYLATDPPAEYASKASLRLSAAYINAKDYDNAIKTLEAAKGKYTDPEMTFAYTRGLGFAYMMRGDDKQNKDDYRKALDYFKQALKIEMADSNLQHVAGSDQNNIRYLQEQLQ